MVSIAQQCLQRNVNRIKIEGFSKTLDSLQPSLMFLHFCKISFLSRKQAPYNQFKGVLTPFVCSQSSESFLVFLTA